ncbi:MAG: hypothetical protein WBC85_07590 [Planktotalea sp.]|uniref:hypothetical protein n=1 Tax=Planktotalea sp. TaxID=2029877 RepID=UPI003C71506A
MSHENDLDQLLAQAKQAPPEPSVDFLARVMSDADAMQPASRGVISAPAKDRNALLGLFAGLGEAIGGWPAFAGLASAAVTGIYIGVSPPQNLIAPFSAAIGDSSILSEALEYGDGFDFTQYEG